MGNRTPTAFVRSLASAQGYTRLLIPQENAASLKSGLVNLAPGEAIGSHSTEAREEVLVILEGKAGVACGESQELEAAAPAMVYIPEHTVHDVANRGQGPLRYIFIVAPV